MKVGDAVDIIREFTDLNGIRTPVGRYSVVAVDRNRTWFKIVSSTSNVHEISQFDINNFTKSVELDLIWPEEYFKCTCGARVTYGADTILHSYWCDAYRDKYEKTRIDDPD